MEGTPKKVLKAGRPALIDELSSPDSTLAVAIGFAEGNRTLGGGFTRNYYGHVDPANRRWNIGTFSYQSYSGPAPKPKDGDLAVLKRMRTEALPVYEKAVEGTDISWETHGLLTASFFDLWIQSPAAATAEGGFAEKIKYLGRATPSQIVRARADAFYDPKSKQFKGFGGDIAAAVRDQQRRTDALVVFLKGRGVI